MREDKIRKCGGFHEALLDTERLRFGKKLGSAPGNFSFNYRTSQVWEHIISFLLVTKIERKAIDLHIAKLICL